MAEELEQTDDQDLEADEAEAEGQQATPGQGGDRFVQVRRGREARKAMRRKRKSKGRSKKDFDKNKLPDTYQGMPMKEVDFTVPPMSERKAARRAFGQVRAEFLKHIGTNHEDLLLKAGMTAEQIASVKSGRTPNGWNTHHQVPIHGGGKNTLDNLVLIPIRPYHENIHKEVIDPQVRGIQSGETRRVRIPITDQPVYIPPDRRSARPVERAVVESATGPGIADRAGRPASKDTIDQGIQAAIAARRQAAR